MTYTHTQKEKAFQRMRIKPLDPSIVRFALTVNVQGYKESVNDELLSLYASLALSKTRSKDKEAIETYLKRYGINFKIESGQGSIRYQGSVRRENVTHAIKLLREILTTLEIDEREFMLKKKLAIEDNREARDDAKRIARIAFSNVLYDRDNFMREHTLDEEFSAISKMQRHHLTDLVSTILSGEWFLTIVGTEAVEMEFEPLKRLIRGKARPVTRVVKEERQRDAGSFFITVPGKTNVEIRLGNIIPITPDHPSFLPLEFGLAVLGKVGGFSGRLMSTVREKEGLTYGIYARTVETHRENTAHWNIYTFFTAQDLKKGMDATRRELTTIVEKGITQAELATFKEILLNQHILNHESNATRLAYYHGLAIHGYEERDIDRMNERIVALTTEEVNESLRAYIDLSRLIIVGAGPVTEDGVGITKP